MNGQEQEPVEISPAALEEEKEEENIEPEEWIASLSTQYQVYEQGQQPTVGLPKEAETYFRVVTLIPLGIIWISMVLFGAIMLTIKGFSAVFLYPTVGFLLLTILAIWFILVYPKRKYQRTRWRFDAEGLLIYRGVWWRKQLAVPRSRVQHIDVTQGPVLRNYDLGELVIHTAGTTDASVTLSGLSHQHAQILRDDLLSQDHSDSV